jgi:hypothetical protein
VIRVLLVYDQPLVLAGLSRILGMDDDIVIVGECSDGSQVPAEPQERPAKSPETARDEESGYTDPQPIRQRCGSGDDDRDNEWKPCAYVADDPAGDWIGCDADEAIDAENDTDHCRGEPEVFPDNRQYRVQE